jgi:cyclophilin family peptidyl-prolyl cis-trans isomerase
VTTPAFPAPGNLIATPLPDASVQLTWQDNTSNEAGFFVEQRELPGGAFANLGVVGANSSSVTITERNPTKQYEFRLRAFTETNGQLITLSSYSNVAAVTSFLVAPSGLTATPEVNGTVSLSWVDNAASENGFIIESRSGSSGPFVALGAVGTNVQAVTILSPNPSTLFEFRIRAFSGFLANPTALSAYSNIAAATTAVLAAPSNFTAVAVPSSPYLVSFSWSDNTVAEFGYEIEFRKQGGSDFTRRFLTGKNDTSAVISEWEPGTNYEFRIRAANGNQVSDYSAVVSATTRNGFSSPRYSPATVGSAFSFQLATLSQSPRVSWSASSLPAGLVFDSQTGIISGNPSTAGVFFIPLTATFADASTHPVNLELRILAPPEITSPFPPQTLLPGTSTTLALGSSFSSPGNHSAVRLTTSKGNIDILLATTTPLTVANFLGYVSRGDYTDVLFHRAPLGFVLQGGGFRSFAAPDVFQRIPSAGTILNEPGISNLTGTIAMAKVGGDPNSATSEFFFNLQNNAANLDFQNGGFTVFGRVSVPTFSGTVTPLSGLDRYNYAVGLNTPTGVVASNFTDLPMDQSPAPTVMDSSKIPKILAASPVPLLSYTLTSNSDPAVATAMVQGAELQINGLTAGTTLLTVTATDLDGNSRSQVISVQVQQTFAQWAASKQLPNGQNGPSDNPDQDSLPNLLEFAFFGNPSVNDVASPTASLAVDGASRFFEITFPVNKLAAGISYRVEASPSLNAASWSTLWTSTQGFAVPVVTATVDQPDRTMVTIRDPAGPPGTPRRFLRLAVTRAP